MRVGTVAGRVARRTRRAAALAVAAWLAVSAAAAAPAGGRAALVIGNGDYARFGDLRNPANDARAMAEKLQSLGFTLVGGEAHVDVTRQAMARLLREFEDELEEGGLERESGERTTALFYYSGHGVAEAGSNWLVPVDDGDIRYREDVPDFAIGARSVMRRLEGRGGGLNIVILDACRNNPLPSRRKTKGSLTRGLARMEAPSETVIVYAAAPGRVAYDGEGELSPFTGALVAEMDRPGRRLMDVLGATAAVVERETSGMPHGRQEPWVELKPLQRPFYFVPSITDPDPPPPPPPPPPDKVIELDFWNFIKDSRNPANFEAYIKRYGENGTFAELARIKLEELSRGGDELELGLEERKDVQRGLSSMGLDVGPIDGLLGGRRTREALRAWQSKRGLKETGRLTREQAEVLIAKGREAAGEEEARRKRLARAVGEALAGAEEALGGGELEKARGHVEELRRLSGGHARLGELEARIEELEEEEKRYPPGKRFRDCAGCPELVVVPAGEYKMGSPGSEVGRYDDGGLLHRVRIGSPFAVGVYEVTRGEYSRFVSATGHSSGDSCWTYEDGEEGYRSGRDWRSPGYRQTDAHPVVCVSWDDAKAYVGWLSEETGEEYRLPSESEWEYVARGGTETARYWGESESGQCGHANGADASAGFAWGVGCNDGYARTAPVGSFGGNGFGLHDVLGNVWEWVEDCWNDSYRGAPADGSAWESEDCGLRVLRGGSWYDGPRGLRAAYRDWFVTGSRSGDAGFRIARTLTP